MAPDQLEEIKRHFGVVAEALRSDIRQIAEGHSVIHHELQEMRHELRNEFEKIASKPPGDEKILVRFPPPHVGVVLPD